MQFVNVQSFFIFHSVPVNSHSEYPCSCRFFPSELLLFILPPTTLILVVGLKKNVTDNIRCGDAPI